MCSYAYHSFGKFYSFDHVVVFHFPRDKIRVACAEYRFHVSGLNKHHAGRNYQFNSYHAAKRYIGFICSICFHGFVVFHSAKGSKYLKTETLVDVTDNTEKFALVTSPLDSGQLYCRSDSTSDIISSFPLNDISRSS